MADFDTHPVDCDVVVVREGTKESIMKHIRILVLTCLVALISYAQAQSEDVTAQKIAALARAHANLEMFSGTVLVARNGNVVYAGAYGEANKDHHVPNKLETRFNIGSIGKTFTAVAVMQLVQEGKLRLSETLGKYYPECPFAEKETITIQNLLTHTSGLGDYLEHKEYKAKLATLRSVGDALPLIFDQKPAFPAGERFQYSNSGFCLLGGIIEKVSGMPYREFVRQHIFEPCGMKKSSICQEDEVLPDRAIGYTQNADGSFTANIRVIPAALSDGGLRTSANDLLKFDQALKGEILLSDQSKQAMFEPSPRRATSASGWEVKEFFGHRYVGHSGGADGVEAFFYRFIDSGYTVIVLSNYHNGAEELTSSIMSLLFDKPYSLPTVADANFRLGYRLQGENMLQDAAKVLARNLAADPPHLLSLFFAANVRIRGGFEIEKALDYLDRYLSLAGEDAFPTKSMAWYQKGSAYLKLGKRPEAIHALEKSLTIDPQNQAARELMGRLRKDEGAAGLVHRSAGDSGYAEDSSSGPHPLKTV
jgi:CubicO group peptidase (beta-lactamase class C family)